MTALILMAGLAAVMLVGARKETKQLQATLAKRLPPAQYLPKVVSLALVVAQISELLKMIEQASIVHLAATLLLFAIAMAGRSGIEGQMHGL